MPKLRRATAEETIRALERLGFTQARQRGSHVILKRPSGDGERICVVPLHRRRLAIGTLRSILRQADVTPDEFMANLS
jgi:predicted RNA binding protein YcfA (HicA-like mRNA interferase family)